MRVASLLRTSLIAAGSSLAFACASPGVPTPKTAASPPAAETPAVADPVPSRDFSAIPPAPASCEAYVAHRAPATCVASGPGDVALASALGLPDSLRRDAALAMLLACPSIAPGVVAALRAELAPPECGDAILGDLGERPDATDDTALRDALVALGLAARLDRLVDAAPELEPPFEKERFQTFLREVLAGWIAGQAQAIQRLSERGSQLSGYGKGIVAVHAGLADMRFVAAVRAVPLPSELGADTELRDAYYGSLDEALEPRKARGRDAALVGLRLLAEVGVLADSRVDRARALLSEVYAGRRIDALDRLLLPTLPAADTDTPVRALAARLPTFYVERVLPGLDATDPALLRALLERGLPATARSALDGAKLRPETRQLGGWALVRSGQLYWRATDFEQAARILGPLERGGAQATDAKLLAAVSRALGRGARDAVEMMSRGPFPGGAPEVTALDALARGTGEPAARAGFDAALILGLAPPTKGARPFFLDLERRFRAAAERATQPGTRAEALARAEAAAATAAAVPN